MPQDDTPPMTGSCLCGGIRFCIQGPLDAVQVCHCGQCRKAQGGPFATNIPVARSALQWLAGRDLLRRYESSPGKTRVFCGTCGSPIYSERTALPEVLRLRAGLLDQPLARGLAFHAYMGSKCNWWPVDDTLPRFEAGEGSRRLPGP